MSAAVDLQRRRFLSTSARAGGLLLSVQLLPAVSLMAQAAVDATLAPGLFVAIDGKGQVTVTCHRSEMGQHIHTAVAQIVADELEADWQRVSVAQGLGDPKYGDQNTDGSRSVRRNLTRLRQAGATARLMLRQAAAARWEVPLEEVTAENHRLSHAASGRSADYGEMVAAATQLAVPEAEAVPLKERKDWRYIGTAMNHVDLDAILAGTAVFGHDVQLADMQVAVIARPPVLFGTVKSLDDTAAKAVTGVSQVVRLPALTAPAAFKALGGVAVIASNTWAAIRGRDALKIEWEHGANASYDSPAFKDALLESVRKPGESTRNQGDVDAALASAAQRVSAEYTVPHLSQAPMETPAATARVSADSAEIWACTQTPQATRGMVAQALGLPPEKVTVHVTMLGGGFGRKSKPDFSVEAALLAREVGKPVKVIWTREDDIRNGYYHSVSAQRIEAGLGADGQVTAWLHRTAFPPIPSTFDPSQKLPSIGELRLGFSDNPFEIANLRLERAPAEAHVRIGWLRSVANVYHAFAIQSFAHELAVAAKRDPKDFLLDLIGSARHIDLGKLGVEYDNYGDSLESFPIDTGRLSNVVRAVAKRSDWSAKRAQGRFLGIAAHRSFLSYVATVVEVEVNDAGQWSIPAAFVVIDAGTVVNLDSVRAQCEGGSIYGLSCAIGQITATGGVIDQSNFDTYTVARMNQAPKAIDVHIVDSSYPAAGVGEPPTPPFAPALANALFEATGQRFRQLPIPLTIPKAKR
ncbi:MAG: xanthine dehydrogenase family protein molybdopterin-binding subunit [Xanthomonadales bacterium]|nr:xanthine dehydrogenase family protein molybdopterin-binding subunit [Xanthomonadales bacterium]